MDIPGYRIVDTLGQGGMATVYLAIQNSFEREVALKVLAPELLKDPSFGERFLREAKIVARLMHHNIVTVYDVGVHENLHYLSMEYVPGKDLKQMRRELSRAQSLRLVIEVARALDYAGRKGYVHRDVKPENIMLHAEDGHAVLMDFGIARPTGLESSMTQTGTAIGTPHYMSPEQAKGKAVDSRSDLYSLGVVLFLLVTGRVPFDADSAVAVGIKHVAEPIPKMDSVFACFQPIINKVLAKDPDHRYQTGMELVADLEQITAQDLERIDQLVTDAVNQLPESDEAAPTVISKPLSRHQTRQIEVAKNAVAGSGGASAAHGDGAFDQHWPQPSKNSDADLAITQPLPALASVWPRRSLYGFAAVLGVVAATVALRTQLPQPWSERVGQLQVQAVEGLEQWGLPAKQVSWLYPPDLQPIQPQPKPNFVSGTGAGAAELDSEVAVKAPLQEPAADIDDIAPPLVASGDANQATTATDTSAPAVISDADRVLADIRPIVDGAATALPNLQVPTTALQKDLQPQPAQVETATPAITATTEVASTDIDPWHRAQALLKSLPVDLTNASTLAALIREQQAKPNGGFKLRQLRRQLVAVYKEQLELSLAANDVSRTQALLDSVAENFPDWSTREPLQTYRDNLARYQQVQPLMAQAQRQLARDALSSPAGDNAIETYRKVLQLAPKFAAAQQGLDAVAKRYAQLAQVKLDRGEFSAALTLAERGLTVGSHTAELNQLRERIAARQKTAQQQQQQLDTILLSADELLAAEQWFGSEGAIATYQQVLALDRSNTRAQTGVYKSAKLSADRIRYLIGAKQFAQAQTVLSDATALLSDHRLLQGLSVELAVAKEDAQPRVDKLRVGSSAALDYDAAQAPLGKVDRTIYIGINFSNFGQTSVLQAILFDGSRSVQIAEVPVVISGASGEKVFRIDRPVEGFADGGYNLDIVLDGNRLNSAHFSIQK